MTLLEKAEKESTESRGLLAVIVAALCVIGIAAYYFYGSRQLNLMDVAVLLVITGFVAYGTTQNILRGVLTGISIYLATAITGTFYRVLTPYARSFLNLLGGRGLNGPPPGGTDTSALALSFAFAALLLWVVLELLFRAALPDTHLAFLGPVDQVGGAIVYLVVGIAVAALVFNLVGYGTAAQTAYQTASLRPELNDVMDLIHQSQSFWFAGDPPAIYAYE